LAALSSIDRLGSCALPLVPARNRSDSGHPVGSLERLGWGERKRTVEIEVNG